MTAQKGEDLIFEGERLVMYSTPLEAYFKQTGFRPPFVEFSTNLSRGYIGKWEIDKGRLYLINLFRIGLRETEAGLQFEWVPNAISVCDIFPDIKGRVFAQWYSGQLRCPQGELKEYHHGGFASVYERDLLIDIENGIVAKVETIINTHGRPHLDINAFADVVCKACTFSKRLRLPEYPEAILFKKCWPVWCKKCGALSLSDYANPPLRCGECGSMRVSIPDRNRQLIPDEKERGIVERWNDTLRSIWCSFAGQSFIRGQVPPSDVKTWGNVIVSNATYLCPKCGEYCLKFEMPYFYHYFKN